MTIVSSLYRWVGQTFGLREEGFWKQYVGHDNYSGKTVTPQTALQLSTVWRCVRLLAETIATLPLELYRLDRQGMKSPATGDILYGILHDAPNGDMTAVDFWESMLASMLLWGNAYARKDMSGGVLVGLTPLRPESMTVRRDEFGALQYVYERAEKGRQIYTAEQVFHVKNFSLDGLVGLSPIAYARNSMGTAMSLDEASATTATRGLRPTGFFHMKEILTPTTRKQVTEGLSERISSQIALGQFPVLEAGLEFQPISMNPQDAQLLQSRSFSVEDICRWFGVPPFMVGYTEKTTSWGTGLEQQNIGFLTYTLRPFLKRIEQQVKKSLVPDNLRATRYAKFNIQALLRADSAARAALYSSASQNGWMTRDEIRELEDMAPFGGGAAKLTAQVNLLPVDDLGKNAPIPAPAIP